ncbi:PRC-barrel domain-containing protein [Vreelandella salicampi]|uniref:PRC-barrel domain-containing protein n=1 Tax=Vreelandella salicampi TaxID=1449798 RepID=A0A7Z0RVS3_9GAMM|nr:PRC-barrel domain-containing protein [Halomonas salicampi]NYS62031.1 PRC-barrel domain-containing protein [Halomonas salicampi]
MRLSQSASILALAIASATVATQAQAEENKGKGNVTAISEWNYDTLYEEGGMTAESLMDTEVFGADDEEIGSVENILLNDKNEIVAVIAQVGGLWDIGDTHVLVPWEEVDVNEDGVSIPVHEDNADDYGLFDEEYVTKTDLSYISQIDDDANTGTRIWKLTDLLDDYASVGEGNGYGYVDNVLFKEDGEIQAVVIEADSSYGGEPYAYPFHGFDTGWDPSYSTYTLPYDEADLDDATAFDYDEYDGLWD